MLSLIYRKKAGRIGVHVQSVHIALLNDSKTMNFVINVYIQRNTLDARVHKENWIIYFFLNTN